MHWRDIEEIAERLEEEYPDEEIPEHDLPYLKDMVLSIPEFEDHRVEVEDMTLKKIVEHWLEIRHHY